MVGLLKSSKCSIQKIETDIESKLIEILESNQLDAISSMLRHIKTKTDYEKIKQTEGMILIALRITRDWHSKQKLNTALIAIRRLLSDFIGKGDT